MSQPVLRIDHNGLSTVAEFVKRDPSVERCLREIRKYNEELKELKKKRTAKKSEITVCGKQIRRMYRQLSSIECDIPSKENQIRAMVDNLASRKKHLRRIYTARKVNKLMQSEPVFLKGSNVG